MDTFVINREHWLHAEVRSILGDSMLNHAPTGCQCCLGQIAQQCGVKPEAMREEGHPIMLHDYERSLLPETFFDDRGQPAPRVQHPLLYEIMRVNDGQTRLGEPDNLTLPEREAKLIALFAQLGLTVTFTGDPTVAVRRALDYLSSIGDTKAVA